MICFKTCLKPTNRYLLLYGTNENELAFKLVKIKDDYEPQKIISGYITHFCGRFILIGLDINKGLFFMDSELTYFQKLVLALF